MLTNPKFYDLLTSNNLISREELKSIRLLFQDASFEIADYLINNKKLDKSKIGRLWGDSIGIAYVDLGRYIVQHQLVVKLEKSFIIENCVIPLYKVGDVITIASNRPDNIFLQERLEKLLGLKVSMVFSFPQDIYKAIEEQFSRKPDEDDKLETNVLDPATETFMIENTRSFLDQALKSKIPSKATAKNISNRIVDDVTFKVDLTQCINQLRVNDEYTYAHSINVAILTSIMAKLLNYSETEIRIITLGAFLHDIGNLRIPKSILYKKGALTEEETNLIKRHSIIGSQTIEKMGLPFEISEIAYNHHELADGTGYPRGLKAKNMSQNAQIVSMVNIYDNLVSDRPNRQGVSISDAVNFLILEGKSFFEPELLNKFTGIIYKQNMAALKTKFKNMFRL